MINLTFPLPDLHGQVRWLMEIKTHKPNIPFLPLWHSLGAEDDAMGHRSSPVLTKIIASP